MKSFNLKLIAPDGVKYEAEATEAIIPTPDGEVTILADHMPLISLIAPGEIILKNGSQEHYLATQGGILEISKNVVKILADTAEDANSLDEIKIEEARKKAELMLQNAKDEVDFANAQSMLEKQLAKLKVLKRRKKYR